VKNEKTKVLVVFEDGRASLEAIAKRMKTSLVDEAAIKTRCASEVAVAEILAADAYAFGVNDASAPAWTEIKRLFQGMNLAGRKAGFFSEKSKQADGLKASFAPTELTVHGDDLVAAGADVAAAWVHALIAAK
jgi:hypothetical protein